jgi:type VI secretion system secreted protein Hcp
MAYDAFLKLTDVKGESADSKHKGEIDILSFSFGANQTGSSAHGGGGGTGKVSLQDFHFVHSVDQSSPVLFQKCATGEHLKEALITVRKAGGEQLEYLKIKLTDVLVSSVQQAGHATAGIVSPRDLATGQASGKTFVREAANSAGDNFPTESISLNFSKITIDYQPQGADGKPQGGAIHGGWDAKQNVKV